MAVHVPTTLFSLDTIQLPLSAAQRLEMEQAVEAAIALLDQDDGDCDLEDDELGDDPLDRGEDPRFCETALIYDIDQSRGPIAHWSEDRLVSAFCPDGRLAHF